MSEDIVIFGGLVLVCALGLWIGWSKCAEEKNKEIAILKQRVSDLEALCRFDNIPELLINNPSFLKGNKPTEEQIQWALKAIEEWRSKKESATPKNSAVLYPDSLPSKQ